MGKSLVPDIHTYKRLLHNKRVHKFHRATKARVFKWAGHCCNGWDVTTRTQSNVPACFRPKKRKEINLKLRLTKPNKLQAR